MGQYIIVGIIVLVLIVLSAYLFLFQPQIEGVDRTPSQGDYGYSSAPLPDGSMKISQTYKYWPEGHLGPKRTVTFSLHVVTAPGENLLRPGGQNEMRIDLSKMIERILRSGLQTAINDPVQANSNLSRSLSALGASSKLFEFIDLMVTIR